jgi:hypothetical protein
MPQKNITNMLYIIENTDLSSMPKIVIFYVLYAISVSLTVRGILTWMPSMDRWWAHASVGEQKESPSSLVPPPPPPPAPGDVPPPPPLGPSLPVQGTGSHAGHYSSRWAPAAGRRALPSSSCRPNGDYLQ